MGWDDGDFEIGRGVRDSAGRTIDDRDLFWSADVGWAELGERTDLCGHNWDDDGRSDAESARNLSGANGGVDGGQCGSKEFRGDPVPRSNESLKPSSGGSRCSH